MTPVPWIPKQPSLVDRVKRLEQDIRRLSKRRTLGHSTISDGDLTVKSRGALKVVDAETGQLVAIIGALPDLDRLDGSAQPGAAFYREDGSIAAFLGDSNPTVPPFKQSWQIFDRQGNVVMADDTNSGKGLAKPFVGGGCFFNDTNVVRWPQTTSGTFVTIADTYYCAENAKVQWDIQHVADPATAGEVRLLVNGAQVDTTQVVGTSFGLWSRFSITLPGVNVGDFPYIALQARRTSGTGGVFSIVQRFQGDQSA